MSVDKLVLDEKFKSDGTGYNDPPKGLRMISQAEFVQGKFFVYPAEHIEHRQILVKSKDNLTRSESLNSGIMIQLKMFWYSDGTGVAMSSDYWKGTIDYFAFGCEHKYHELSQEECRKRDIMHSGRCFHVTECEKCGYVTAYDSSD